MVRFFEIKTLFLKLTDPFQVESREREFDWETAIFVVVFAILVFLAFTYIKASIVLSGSPSFLIKCSG